MIVETDIAALSVREIRRAELAAKALTHWASTNDEPAVEQVARSIQASLEAERTARHDGRGRGTVRLAVPNFADDDPDEAERARRRVVGFLGVVRDDPDELPAVRRLFADIMADLANPTPTARQVELARLDALAGSVNVA